jgi:hypothetical protein
MSWYFPAIHAKKYPSTRPASVPAAPIVNLAENISVGVM